MNETRVVAKSSDEEMLFSILADAKIEETTYTVGYNIETKEWTDVEWLAFFPRWIPIEVKEYGESIEVPPELVAEIKRKQKKYDEAHKAEEL